jgi:hypothetical protein
MKIIIIAVLGMFALTGCTPAGKAAVGLGIEKIKEGEDNALGLAFQAICAPSVGAFYRATRSQRRVMEAACGGEPMPKPALNNSAVE